MNILSPSGPRFHIAVNGQGRFLDEILSLVRPGEPLTLSPGSAILAVIDPKPSQQTLTSLARHGLAPYADLSSAFAAHPSINCLIDLTGKLLSGPPDPAIPGATGVFGPHQADLILDILSPDTDCLRCRNELARTRQLLHTIINQMQDDLILLDAQGTVLDLNDVNLERIGLTRREVTGKPCWEVLSGYGKFRESPENFAAFRDSLTSGQTADFVDAQVDGQGRLVYHRIYAYPVHVNGDQALSHIVIMRRDITQRTQMENRLQQSEKLAAIGELSTYIAHEIRNPLFAIAGFANSLLRSKSLDEADREKAQIITEESNRLDKILKSIVNFARPTLSVAGEIDVNQAITDTLAVMSMGFGKKNIQVAQDLAANLPKVRGEDEMLKQCLINLIRNADEAMPQGGILTIATGFDGAAIVLSVADTGSGIAPEILEQVFNPFFSTKGKGSGLGLAMTKKILDGIGGNVDIASKLGEGTRVTLKLPPILAVPGGE